MAKEVKKGAKVQRRRATKSKDASEVRARSSPEPTLEMKWKIRPWIENKIKRARKLSKHRAARAAGRWGAPAGVTLAIALTLFSVFSPKSESQILQEKLAKNPNDFETHLQLAERFLENNQLEEAEKVLLLAQRIKNYESGIVNNESNENVLGEKDEAKLEELWERKRYSDPEDIRQLIAAWEKIMEGKPDYRDGWLQLATLHYKLYENEKAKECLEKALELDPNYEPARKLEKLLAD